MAEAAKTSSLQILTYIRRRRTLTSEQFYAHWENTHAPKVIPWAEKHGIRRYQQVYTPIDCSLSLADTNPRRSTYLAV